MADDPAPDFVPAVTLRGALDQYMQALKPDQLPGAWYVERYVERVGHEMSVSALSGSRVELYAEQWIRVSDPAAGDQVSSLKLWFAFLKKKNFTTENYGIHLRVRRAPSRTPGALVTRLEETPVQMTPAGLEALKAELDEVAARTPELVHAVATAREDKDFRENAPLDAAREALAFHEQRRKQLESTLKRAVVVETAADDRAVVGSAVTVTRLDTNVKATYTLVSASEANAAERRISVQSPVGQRLLGARAGDEVAVAAPSGSIDFRIESVTHAH